MFNVVFTGLKDGVTEDEFVANFCQKFGLSEQKARKIAQSSSDVIIKKDLAEEKATKYKAVLDGCGMIARLDEIVIEPEYEAKPEPESQAEPETGSGSGLTLAPIEEKSSADEPDTGTSTDKSQCPKCGSDQISGDECLACGIYISKYRASMEKAAIITDTAEEPEIDDEPTDMVSNVSNPYATPEAELNESSDELGMEKVPLGSGTYWLGRGFWHFRQNPFAWIGSIVVFMILFFILALIPFLGGILTNLLSPVVMAGFAIGAHEQDEGGDFRVGHVFAGFSSSVGQLMLVGVLYFVALLIIVVIFGLIMGGTMASSGMMGANMNPAAFMENMEIGFILMSLVFFILMIVITMSYYYAPVLVALEDMSAIGAMKMSLQACLKNWLAFIIYGLIVMVLFIVASLPVFLGLLVAIPMVQASIYVSYRDIFHHDR